MVDSSPTLPATVSGGCHCGAVRFELVLRSLEALECNCSMCTAKGFLHVIVPAEDFHLLRGEAALTEYRFGTGTARHLFCSTCGIHAFYRPRSHPDGWSVNARCLAPPWPDMFTIRPFDGRNWEANIDSIR